MKKAMMLSSMLSTIGQFNMDNIRILQRNGYEVDVAATMGEENPISSDKLAQMKKMMEEEGVHLIDVSVPRKITDIKGIVSAYRKAKKLCDEKAYEIVHCHSPIGSVIARFAARKARKKHGTRVIYTAHGFHFFKGSPLINWLLYFPIEWFCAFFTDMIITINHEDYMRAKKYLHAKQVAYVPGVGVDTEKFASSSCVNREEMRKSLGISAEDVMLLSVGEISKRKNQRVIIEALGKLKNPNLHYYIVGVGEKETELRALAAEDGVEKNVHFLGFRKDVAVLCQAADIFCFPSFQEGLPVALMEAMGVGLPCVASSIRGNEDLLQNEKGGYLYAPTDVQGFSEGIQRLVKASDLRQKMGQNNVEQIKAFDIKIISEKMQKIYVGERA